MSEVALTAFAALFVVIDPLGNLPIFVALTSGQDAAYKRRMAIRGVAIGRGRVRLLRVRRRPTPRAARHRPPGLPDGGRPHADGHRLPRWCSRSGTRDGRTRAESIAEESGPRDISVFPIAIPLVSGPGGITTLLLILSGYAGQRAEPGDRARDAGHRARDPARPLPAGAAASSGCSARP